MGIHPTLKRLLEAAILSAVAGGTTYGFTVWLAPPTVSAFLVAVIVAVITALGFAMPSAALSAFERGKEGPSSPPETYYDLDFSLEKYRRNQED